MLLLLGALLAAATPVEMSHQGRLLDALGSPVSSASTDVDVSIWTASSGGIQLFSESHSGVAVADGYYAVALGSQSVLDSAVFDANVTWLQVAFDGNPPLPRLPLHSVPVAAHALDADRAATATAVSGGVVDASELRINGQSVITGSGALASGQTLGVLNCDVSDVPVWQGSSWGCTGASEHSHALSTLSGTLTPSQMPTSAVNLSAGSTIDGQPISDLSASGAVSAVAASDDYVSNTGDTVAGDLVVNGAVSSPNTWGMTARAQGVMAFPEGNVYQDGSSVVFTSNVIVMNPAAGSYMRVAAGSYSLPDWGYLYVDLPPTGTRGIVVTPSVGSWADSDRGYDHPDRFVLAQRQAGNLIYLNMAVPAHGMTAPSRLITRTSGSLGDRRNEAGVSVAGSWWQIPGRSLTFNKRYGDSAIKVTYQDTFGTQGNLYQGCEWRVLIDGTPYHTFSTADHDRGAGESSDWTMATATQTVWQMSLGTGNHVVTVENRGDRGAWGSGTDECLTGWNTTTNFISVEEIP